MSGAAFRIVPIEAAHDRTTFEIASAMLDRYFRHQITRDIRRRVTASFVALTQEGRIAGYYTLASASILLADLPATTSKKLPRYPSVPAVRMGRLAVDRSFQGQGLGGALLADALERVARSEIAAFSLVVDAKDESAAAFYRHHSFIALPDSPLTLFLPLATIPPSFRGLGANELPLTIRGTSPISPSPIAPYLLSPRRRHARRPSLLLSFAGQGQTRPKPHSMPR